MEMLALITIIVMVKWIVIGWAVLWVIPWLHGGPVELRREWRRRLLGLGTRQG